ncbi:hypothetical protein [Kribbella pratensis]|uniref:Uncharacterized protein n=1 Tax=Kribbella pratensis TaxID=2512112 RepID=A0A4R8BWK4_9ACTN|nr:hypothetical protein [Kribbella pratensis]TDW66191.1 hypothetical protein EV653_6213 [Kribbella pratensis]
MEKRTNPEIKGVPDPIEKRPRHEASEETKRALGRAAIKKSQQR